MLVAKVGKVVDLRGVEEKGGSKRMHRCVSPLLEF